MKPTKALFERASISVFSFGRNLGHVHTYPVKTQTFFYEYGLRPHVSSVFYGRIRKFLKTLSRVEIFFIRYEYVYVWTVVSGNLRKTLMSFSWFQSSRRAL